METETMERHHPTEALAALALGCLDTEEDAEVRAHVEGCATCRAELRALEETGALLAYAAPDAAPSEGLRARLLAGLPRRRSYAWFERLLERWPRLVPVTAVSAVALAAILGTASLVIPLRGGRTQELLATVQLVRLQATPRMPAASGVILVPPDESGGVLVVAALEELDRSLQYQLWLIENGRRTSGGTFSVAAGGAGRVVIASTRPLTDFDAFGITIEPFGGSPAPTGEKVLGGKLVL
jgi:anti-sigma-K factor RskA